MLNIIKIEHESNTCHFAVDTVEELDLLPKINTKGQKLPYLERLVYIIVGDLNNEVLKFEAGELDVISLQGSKVARYKSLEPHSDFKL